MTVKQILNATAHRPWGLPDGNWKYYQEWNNAIFLHWKTDLDTLRTFVPAGIEIDLFEGHPWISLVAFTMDRVRMQNLPSFSPLSNFDEINIRTYVKHHNKSGVYFLSIEGGTRASCKLAKALSGLPYRYSRMKRLEQRYSSYNEAFSDKLDISYDIGQRIENKTRRDKWLTERYALFLDDRRGINEFDIHHIEWPINQIQLTALNVQYARFANILTGAPHSAHYSTGVQVIGWDKRTNIVRASHDNV